MQSFPDARFEPILVPDISHKGQVSWREVHKPNKDMRRAHNAVKSMLWLYTPLVSTTGGVRGGSPMTHISRHRDSRYIFQADIAKAFYQVKPEELIERAERHGQLEYYLSSNDPSADLGELIVDFCIKPEGQGLYMGGPASNLLFDIYARDMDVQMQTYSEEEGLIYSRYVDDLAFSSIDTGFKTRDAIGKKRRREIAAIALGGDLALNTAKSRADDISRGPVTMVGLQLNQNGSVQVPTMILRRIPKIVDAHLGGPLQEALDLVNGYIGYLSSNKDRRRPGFIQTQQHDKTLRYLEAARSDINSQLRYR